MTIGFGTALVVCALAASIVLVLRGGARTVSMVALIACAIEALIVLHVIHLALARFSIEAILPAIMAGAGAIAWTRASAKTAITAATIIALVGAIRLLHALHLLRAG